MGKVEILVAKASLEMNSRGLRWCPEFFEVMPLAAGRNPEQYKWKFPS